MRTSSPIAILALALAALPGRARPEDAARRDDVVSLRFAWPDPLTAEVAYRRTRTRTGDPASTFTARYTQVAERRGDGWHIRASGTRWSGDLPFPEAIADDARRASEAVVQRVALDGEFSGLEGADALRPVLTAALERPDLRKEQVERAVATGEAAMRAESEEMWNLGVGFWIGADLELGARYGMENEAEVPLLSGTTAEYQVEFSARRRVPCLATEREARCVEITLRSVPAPQVLPRITKALLVRLAGSEAAAATGALREVSVENELVLVTEPATLLPHRLVWTRRVRATADGNDAHAVEQVDRREYDYRYGVAKKPAPKRKRVPKPKRAVAAHAAEKPAPPPAPVPAAAVEQASPALAPAAPAPGR